MSTLEANISSIYGDLGNAWLQSLPEIVNGIAKQYGLSALNPLSNLSYHYGLSGIQDHQPIILKLGPDIDGLKREAAALKAFAGFGAANVLAEGAGFLLLERAIPGHSLKTYLPEKESEIIEIACKVAKRLHGAPLFLTKASTAAFPDVRAWLTLLDQEWDIPAHYLCKARKLRNQLLTTAAKPLLLHGDLHHDNILKNGDDWLIIDPKGVVGFPINEVWAFVVNIEQDTAFIADFFEFKLTEVRSWYFVHLILAICWALEDHTDPTLFMQRADKALNFLSCS